MPPGPPSHSFDCVGASGSTNMVQGSEAERTGPAASPSSVTGSWAQGAGHGHVANQGQTQTSLTLSPSNRAGLPLPWPPSSGTFKRGLRKNTEKHSLGESPPSLPVLQVDTQEQLRGHPSVLPVPPAPPFGSGPSTGNGPGTFQGCSTGWQVRETCLSPGICSLTWPPRGGPIRVVLSSRTGHCQQGAEKQHPPRAGGGTVEPGTRGGRFSLLHPGTQHPDSPSSEASGGSQRERG